MKRDLNRKLKHFGNQNATDAPGSVETGPDSSNVMSPSKDQLQETIYIDCDEVYRKYRDAVNVQSQIQLFRDQNASRLEELNALTKNIDEIDESAFTVSQSDMLRLNRLKVSYYLLPVFDTVLASLSYFSILSHHLRSFQPYNAVFAVLATVTLSTVFAIVHRCTLSIIDVKAEMSPKRKIVFAVLLALCLFVVPSIYMTSWLGFGSDKIYCITMAGISFIIQSVSSFLYKPFIELNSKVAEKKDLENYVKAAKEEETVLENAVKATDARIQELPFECVTSVNDVLRQAFTQLRKDYNKYHNLFNEEPDLDLPATTLFFCQAYYLQRIEIPIPKIEALLTIDDLTSLSATFTEAHQTLRIPQNLMADLQSALDAPATPAAPSPTLGPPSTPVTEPAPSTAPEPTPTTAPDDSLPDIVDYSDDTDDDDFDPFHY